MYNLTISSTIDAPFLKKLASVEGTWGYGPVPDNPQEQTIMFDEEYLEEIQTALASYDTAWLESLKPAIIERIAIQRKITVITKFSFNGMPIKLDPDTENAISKAYSALSRQPEGTSVDWEIARGVFTEFNLPIVAALSDAAFLHVQNCFSNAKRLTQLVNAAADLATLNAIDVYDGWPS